MALTRPTAAQITTTTVDFTDPLMRLNKEQSGANDKDIGIIFERGSDTNVAVIWDESTDQVAVITTNEIGTTVGNVSIIGYADFRANTITAALSGNATTATTLQTARTIAISGDVTGTATSFNGSADITISSAITAGSIVDADINASAAIADTKLATISTAGKVSNSATTAASANTANAIVARDSSGNFTAGVITGDQVISTNNGAGTNFKVGDDVWIGDVNLDNTIRITGQQDATKGYIVFGNSNTTALGRSGTGPLTYGGLFSAVELTSTNASGDEGGQINLSIPVTNTTLGGTVTVDVYQNKLRFFEGSVNAKGAYIDLSACANSVGTNLLGASVPGDGTLTLAVSGTGLSGSASFTANQSSGSTFTVTSNATSANTVSTIVARDASGDFSAGTITASGLTLNGNSTFSNGLFTFNTPAGSLGSTAGAVNTLQIYQATGNTDAFQSFHVNGDYAVHFGLDGTTNDLFVGGWSMGANKYKIWHAGNDGTGSGLDADTVDGYNPATTNTGNTIVLRDASGDFSANIITATSTSARYADLAENYLADKIYPVGTVLMIGGSAEITIAVKDSSPVIGTVSENPAYLMNSSLTGDYVTPVAYIGRVPCRVVGYIRKGTRLILSNIPGVACAALSNNEIDYQAVGIALQDYNSNTEGLIEILVGR